MPAVDACPLMTGPPAHRTLFVLPSLTMGGAEIALLRVLRLLQESLHLDVLTFSQGDGIERSLPPRIRHRCLGLDLGRRSPDFLRIPGSMRRFLGESRPDVVVSVLPYAHWAVGLAVSRMRGPRWIVWEQCDLSPEVAHQRYAPLKRWWLRRLLPGADGAVAVSEGVRRDLIDSWGLAPHRVRTIPNPLDPDSITEAAHPGAPHPWLTQDIPVIAYVGRLAPQKNLQFLLRAFGAAASHERLRLLMLGDGPEREALRREIGRLGLSDSVRLLGPVKDPRPYLRGACALVLPSLWEGFSNVTLEAMACGLPVAAADCPGPRELLRGGCGILLPSGDLSAWSGAMTRLVRDEDLRRSLGESGQRRALDFSPRSLRPLFAEAFA